MPRPSLLIAEDHPVMGVGLRALFEDQFEVHGPCADGNAVAGLVTQLRPAILILDLSLPGRNGMYLLPEVKRCSPGTRVIIYTMYADFDLMEEARRRGADGYVGKEAGVEELQWAVEAVERGEPGFSRLILPPRRRARGSGPHAAAIARLTSRRQEILALIGEGLTTTEISARLEMAERTIYWHRTMIRKALGIATDQDLARAAAVWLQAVHQAESAAPGSPEKPADPSR